jgi:ribonucleoside-diphosphate reductase alpha chain
MESLQDMKNKAWYWLNEDSRNFLNKGYLVNGQTPEQRYRQMAEKAEHYLGEAGFADKLFHYTSLGDYSFASPQVSNYGNNRGFPVSCFGGYIEDTMDSILYTHYEQAVLTKNGGGTSIYAGDIRPRGSIITDNGLSEGVLPFLRMFDTMTGVVSQGETRRGYMAAYLPIDHGDIEEFLEIGADGNAIQGLMTGVTVSDAWLKDMEAGDKDKRKLWAKLLRKRSEQGFPYVVFSDNMNKNKPECYKDMPIHASNLCSEIALPSSKDESFICVLSSMNLLHYDEWKDTDAVEVLVKFLDTSVTDFLIKLENQGAVKKGSPLHRVYNFAKNHRALGLGVLGWHSYLQSKGIPFESKEAAKLNYEIFRNIRERSEQASIALATDFGNVMGTNRRNTTLIAVAPTKSSSFILGQVSQGIEPILSNYFIDDKAKARVVYKNPYLVKLLQERGKDTQATWDMIMKADGSVQLLPFLTDEEKEVFKTFAEINPEAILSQAAVRQEFIDQAQSINLMIPADLPLKELNSLYFTAWKLGIKSLYYQYSLSAAQEFTRSKAMSSECVACHS